MQLSKLNLTICTTLLCWSASGIQASEDTPAQALARKAMLQRMQQTDADATATGKAPPAQYFTSSKETPAQAMALAAIRQRMQATDQTGAVSSRSGGLVVHESDTVSQALARAAVLKRMREEDRAGTAHGQKLAAKAAAKERAAAKAQARKMAAEHARALKKAKKEAARAKAPKHAPETLVTVSYPAQEAGIPPVARPGLAHPPAVQARLDALLQRYLSNSLSPAEYYRERAAILAAQ